MKLLVGFSVFVDTVRGTPPVPTQSAVLILPPALDPLPIATFSSTLKITGTGQQGLTIVLYINDKEFKKVSLSKSASFSAQLTDLNDGLNTISAKLVDDKGNMSDLSNILTTTIKKTLPILEITSPDNNTAINGDSNLVTISGKSEDNTTVTVNDRVVVVRSDNTFSYQYPLSEGDNKLTIKATDQAGNTTTVERNVKYQK
jgi:bacillopeptidase F